LGWLPVIGDGRPENIRDNLTEIQSQYNKIASILFITAGCTKLFGDKQANPRLKYRNEITNYVK